jgi:hypothetical protein
MEPDLANLGPLHRRHHGVRTVLVSDRWPHAALWWAAALLAFGIADILVFFATI